LVQEFKEYEDYITEIIEAAMLVLLIGKFMLYAVEMASCSMIYIPSLTKTDTGVQAILRFCLSNLNAVMLVLPL
jgi:ethanolamine ammonia-lyase small subunit